MSNIYKKQAVSDYAHRYYSSEGNFGQQMMAQGEEYKKKAEKHEASAQNKYAKYLDLITQDKFNELSEDANLMGNPEALKREMLRIRDGVAEGVKDKDVKTAYMGGTDEYIMRSVERAADHKRRLAEREKAAQEAQAKSDQKQLKKYQNARLQNDFIFHANELLQTYASNPTKLREELDKLSSDIAGTMSDDEEKLKFLTDTELKKTSLVTNAQNNLFDATNKMFRDTDVENIDAATSEITTILDNVWSGNYDEADLVNMAIAYQKLDSSLYAKNPDGSDRLSEKEKAKARENIDNAMVRGFQNYYSKLEPYDQKKVAEEIEKSKGGIQLEGVYFNYIQPKTLNKMKDYIRDYASIKKGNDERFSYEESVAQYSSEKELNKALEDLDPIDALHLLADNRAKVSKKYYDAKLQQLNVNAGIRSTTEAKVYGKLVEQIEAINSFDGSAEEIINSANTVLENIEEAYSQNKLRKDDKENLLSLLDSINEENLPELIDDKSGIWDYLVYNYKDAQNAFKKILFNEDNLDKAMLEYHRTISKNKKLSHNEKRKLVRTIADNYNNNALDRAVTYGKVAKKGENVVDWQVYFKE